MPAGFQEGESLLPVWSRANSKQTMVMVILGLLLNTGEDLEMWTVSNCRALGLERLGHIQTNGPTEPPSIRFFISQMKLIGFSGRNWEVIHHLFNRQLLGINSGHCTKRKGRSRCVCTVLLFCLSQYGVALGKLWGAQEITSAVYEPYTCHAEIHL